jgi:hypothetical protein
MNNEKIKFCAIMSDKISMKSGAHPTSVLALRLARTETETCVPITHASRIMPRMISSGYPIPLGYESTAHRVLSIPELLQTIFGFGSQASNVSNALVCRNWHEPEARPSVLTHNAFATSTVLLQVLQLPHSLHFSSMYSIFKQSYSILQSNIVTM